MDIGKEISNQLVNPAVYADTELLSDIFRQLRSESPFAKAHPDGFEPFWVATRHADVMDIEKCAGTFHCGDKASTLLPLWEELIPRLKSIRLTAEPQMYLSTFVIGPKTVPIEFEVE